MVEFRIHKFRIWARSFAVKGIDTGLLAQVQNYSTWVVSIVVVGHIINAWAEAGIYDIRTGADIGDSTTSRWCTVEAVATNLELAVLLWQVATAVFSIVSLFFVDWLNAGDHKRNLFLFFHIVIGAAVLTTTIVPGALGASKSLNVSLRTLL